LSVSYKELKAAIAQNDGQAPVQASLVSAMASGEPQLLFVSSAAASAATESNPKRIYVEQTGTGYKLGVRSASGALITLTADRSTGYAPVFSGGAGGAVVVSAPVNSVLPLISGTIHVGQTLNASTGSWSGSPTGYAYQWQRCDSGGINCVNVGSNQASYQLVTADNGRMIVSVTATNSGGNATVSSTATNVTSPVYAYVANYGGNSVSVIATATNVVGSTITVGAHPQGIAVSPDGAYVYVANNTAGTVSVIRTSDNTVVATVTVGANPYGIAVTPDGSHVYVVNNNSSGTVSVIATATNAVVGSPIAVGSSPVAVAVSPDGAHVYVTNSGSTATGGNSVSVITTGTTPTVTATVSVVVGGNNPSPRGVAVTPDGAYVYVTNYFAGTVSVIATATSTVTATVPVGSNPQWIAVAPDGLHAYVANSGGSNVSVITTGTTPTVTATVSPEGGTLLGVAVTPDSSHVYVVSSSWSEVSVITAATNIVTPNVAVGSSPQGIAITP
jgi:YVTN family beta-propeller protein